MRISVPLSDNNGDPATGLAPIISITNLDTSTEEVTWDTMTEVSSGWYTYVHSSASVSASYTSIIDGGASLNNRYAFVGNDHGADTITQTLLTEPVSAHINGNDSSVAHHLHDIHHQEIKIFVDGEVATNGNGTANNPFDNIGDALDLAEEHNTRIIVVMSEITLDRNLKNFIIEGRGVPIINCNGNDLKGTIFNKCHLRGTYTDTVIAQESVLGQDFDLNGYFENCALLGELTCNVATSASPALLKNCTAMTRTESISLNGVLANNLIISQFSGHLTIKNMTNAGDYVSLTSPDAHTIIDSTCTAGTICIHGGVKITDNSTGTTVDDHTYSTNIINILEDTGTTIPTQITNLNDPTVEEIRTEMDSNSTQLSGIIEDTGTTIPTQITNLNDISAIDVRTEMDSNSIVLAFIRKVLGNKLIVDKANSRLVLYDDDGITAINSWSLADIFGANIDVPAGPPSIRGPKVDL